MGYTVRLVNDSFEGYPFSSTGQLHGSESLYPLQDLGIGFSFHDITPAFDGLGESLVDPIVPHNCGHQHISWPPLSFSVAISHATPCSVSNSQDGQQTPVAHQPGHASLPESQPVCQPLTFKPQEAAAEMPSLTTKGTLHMPLPIDSSLILKSQPDATDAHTVTAQPYIRVPLPANDPVVFQSRTEARIAFNKQDLPKECYQEDCNCHKLASRQIPHNVSYTSIDDRVVMTAFGD